MARVTKPRISPRIAAIAESATLAVDARAKADCVRNAAQRLGLQRAQIITMGDGANDLAMMAESGVSIAFHAKPAVRAQAGHAFNHAGLDGVLALFPPRGMRYVDMR